MEHENQLPKRKKNRLEYYDYSSCGAYFITICTKDKKCVFWSKQQPNFVGATIGRPQDVGLSFYGKVVDEAINNISEIYPSIFVETYVIMPNHIHLLLMICADENGRPMVAPTISRVVQQMKGYVTKRLGVSVWQKLFYDHIIRNQEDYEKHVNYICENPAKWQDDCLYSEE